MVEPLVRPLPFVARAISVGLSTHWADGLIRVVDAEPYLYASPDSPWAWSMRVTMTYARDRLLVAFLDFMVDHLPRDCAEYLFETVFERVFTAQERVAVTFHYMQGVFLYPSHSLTHSWSIANLEHRCECDRSWRETLERVLNQRWGLAFHQVYPYLYEFSKQFVHHFQEFRVFYAHRFLAVRAMLEDETTRAVGGWKQ